MKQRVNVLEILLILALLMPLQGRPLTNLISETTDSTVFEVKWDEPHLIPTQGDTVLITMDGCGPRGRKGEPQLVGRAFNVAVPRDAHIDVKLSQVEWSEWKRAFPAPESEDPKKPVRPILDAYNHPAGGTVKIAYDQIWRGVRVIGVDIVPVEYAPQKGIRFMKRAIVTVHHHGNQPVADPRHYHPIMGQFYRSTLINPESAIPSKTFSISEWNPDSGAELLVITTSDFYEHSLPWINWKLFMGMPTIVALTDTIGSSTASIKDFVSNAYHNWSIPPMYLLIIGDVEEVPTHTETDFIVNDLWYCMVDGDDIFPDILPGRVSVDNNDQLDVFVTKLLNYEAEPETVDQWFLRGIGVVRRDDCDYLGPVDSSYCAAVYYAMEACSLAGFYSTPVFVNCDGVDGITDYFLEGANLVTYRGQASPTWWSPFDSLPFLPSGKKLPIYVSITCATGEFHVGDRLPCETVTRAGTVDNPEGGVAWIGQGRCSTNSLERSSLSKNIFAGWFEAKLNAVEAAHQYGRTQMYAEFGGSHAARVEYQSSGLVGSPEMFAWTGPIYLPDIVSPLSLSLGENDFYVIVTRDGAPLENARVCVHHGDRFSYAITDTLGLARISVNIMPEESVYIVVTGPNIYPTSQNILVEVTPFNIASAPATYFDIVGDGDGIANPGETIAMIPRIVNNGDTTIGPFTGVVRCYDTLITLEDSTTSFPEVAPGDTAEGDTVILTISTLHPTGAFPMLLALLLPDTEARIMISPMLNVERFAIGDYKFSIIDTFPQDNHDSIPQAGEEILVTLQLANPTNADCFNMKARVLPGSYAPAIIEMDSLIVGDLLRGTVSNSTTGLLLNMMMFPDSDTVSIPVEITGECPMYDFADTFELSIKLGEIRPIYSDSIRYYIISNKNFYISNHPSFTWQDISDSANLLLSITNHDDDTAIVSLPFTFQYYGETYDTIVVSTNGCLSVENINPPSHPSILPKYDAYNGIIAPFWSDLNPHDAGDIYYYYDPDSGKIIIQYDSVQFYYFTGTVKFQVIIYDTTYHPTPTGDNEIYFVFNRCFPPFNDFTIGIENQTGTIGITYYSSLDTTAPPWRPDSGIVLKVTTSPPDTVYPWFIFYSSPTFDDSLSDGDGLIESGELVEAKFAIKNGGLSDAYDLVAVVESTEYVIPVGDTVYFDTLHVGQVKDNFSSPLRFALFAPPEQPVMVPIKFVDKSTGFTAVLPAYIVCSPSQVEENFSAAVPQKPEITVIPNPFNSTAIVRFTVPGKEGKNEVWVTINLFDISGKLVRTAFDGYMAPGENTITINSYGLKSGLYFIKVDVGGRSHSEKLLLIK